MKKMILLSLAIVSLSLFTNAQTVGKVEIKDTGYTQKKMKDAPRRVFISQFRVVYQLMADWAEIAEGGSVVGGGVRGKAEARLAIGLQGIEDSDLMDITDKLYNEYIEKLKAAGFEIVSADEAQKIDQYADYERKSGGSLSLAQYPGYVMSTPTGYDYFVKKTTDNGREKKSFLEVSPKVSTGLDGALVAKVNIIVKSISEAESAGSKMLGKLSGGVAKVVMETDLRLANDLVAGEGVFTTDLATTQAAVYYQKNLGNQGQSICALKDPVAIDGVIESKKYKSVETAQYDFQGLSMGTMRMFSADDSYFENIQAVPVDAAKYKKGVLEASSSFLNASLDELFSYTK